MLMKAGGNGMSDDTARTVFGNHNIQVSGRIFIGGEA